jgi:hypothetical protein
MGSKSRCILSVITVAAYDIDRLKVTLESFKGAPNGVEFIVVCPESDFETIQYFKNFASKSTLTISLHHDRALGIYEAMNLGVRCSSGKFVTFWNAGDTCSSITNLSKLVNQLKTSSHRWVIVSAEFDWRDSLILNDNNLRRFVLQLGGYISHQSMVVKRLEFLILGGYDTKYRIAADTKLMTLLWKKYKVLFFEQPLIRVEFPNFSGKHNRLGRLENIKICITVIPWRFKLLSLAYAISRELQYVKVRLNKSNLRIDTK